jgi:hypothetical protein
MDPDRAATAEETEAVTIKAAEVMAKVDMAVPALDDQIQVATSRIDTIVHHHQHQHQPKQRAETMGEAIGIIKAVATTRPQDAKQVHTVRMIDAIRVVIPAAVKMRMANQLADLELVVKTNMVCPYRDNSFFG